MDSKPRCAPRPIRPLCRRGVREARIPFDWNLDRSTIHQINGQEISCDPDVTYSLTFPR
jgi:hypothetical protein